MSEFKAGDLVRVTLKTGPHAAQEGTVKEIHFTGWVLVELRDDERYFSPYELEIFDPAPVVKDTHKHEEPYFVHLAGRHEYSIDGSVTVVVEDGDMTFFRDGEKMFTISEWDNSEFEMAYIRDRIDQIVEGISGG